MLGRFVRLSGVGLGALACKLSGARFRALGAER